MDKQKQIQTEELIGIIQGAVGGCAKHWASLIAEEVLKYYQPKSPENAVVLTREEYEELKKGIKTYNYTAMFDAQSAYRWEQGYLQGTKETAEKFARKAKESFFGVNCIDIDEWNWYHDKLDKICKEITEGKNG